MKTQQEIDYNRIAEAISFFRENFKSQPSLDDVAEHVHLSPFHFQRMFLEWAGVTPKQFLQYLSIEHAKEILKNTNSNLFETAFETGLSGTGRLHDLFIKVEGMTPGEYKNGGSSLQINYSFADTPFGKVIVASTNKGICHMAFVDEGEELALEKLRANYPKASYSQIVDRIQQNALFIFTQDWSRLESWAAHMPGWIMLGVSGRAGFNESLPTGDAATPQVRANRYSGWVGLEWNQPDLRISGEIGREKISPKLESQSRFGGARTRYLVAADYRLGDTGLWVNLSHGEAKGVGALKDDKVTRLTFSFSDPPPPDVLAEKRTAAGQD